MTQSSLENLSEIVKSPFNLQYEALFEIGHEMLYYIDRVSSDSIGVPIYFNLSTKSLSKLKPMWDDFVLPKLEDFYKKNIFVADRRFEEWSSGVEGAVFSVL